MAADGGAFAFEVVVALALLFLILPPRFDPAIRLMARNARVRARREKHDGR